MYLLISLIGAVVFVLVFRNAILRFPSVFYVLTLVVILLPLLNFFTGSQTIDFLHLRRYWQGGIIAFALFSIVMYIGVLPQSSALRHYLAPIRGPLSIIASILIIGHIVIYSASYVPRVISGALYTAQPLFLISLAVALILVVVLAPLAFTSFVSVRQRITPEHWSRIQKLAYVFFALVLVHILCLHLPSALQGAPHSRNAVIGYSLVIVLYFGLRLVKEYREKRANRISG